MISKNMNYCFNVEYYKDLKYIYYIGQRGHDTEKEEDEGTLKDRDIYIENFDFCSCPTVYRLFKEPNENNRMSFELYTAYPGVLIGTGNPHEISMENAIKCGFSFDYVTGLPYIPGSSIKGMLRSYFPKEGSADENEKREYIKEVLNSCGITFQTENKEKIKTVIANLKKDLFEGEDAFFDAFPVVLPNQKIKLLAREFITPHKEKFKNPKPINLIKIRPGVKIRFMFILNDFNFENCCISANQKLALLKRIILDMGVGAKTNVGFGIMTEKQPQDNRQIMTDTNNNGHRSQQSGATFCSNNRNGQRQGGNRSNRNSTSRNNNVSHNRGY